MVRLILFALLLAAAPAWAGNSIAEAPVEGLPATIAANGQWTSQCLAIMPPFDVAAALEGAGTLIVQRFADKACQFPVRPPVSAALASAANCYAAPSFCGDLPSPDQVPHLGLKVTLKDTSGKPNHVYGLRLVQDPPWTTDPPPATAQGASR